MRIGKCSGSQIQILEKVKLNISIFDRNLSNFIISILNTPHFKKHDTRLDDIHFTHVTLPS